MIAGGVPSYGGHSREAKSSLQKMAVSVADLDQIATGLVGKLEKRVICGVVNKIAAGTR